MLRRGLSTLNELDAIEAKEAKEAAARNCEILPPSLGPLTP